MATILKAVPVLKGKESKRFNAAISANETNKIPKAKKEEMFSLIDRIMAKQQNVNGFN